MAVQVNIERTRGDTYRLRITFTNADDGSPIDLTGATVVLAVNELQWPTDIAEQLFEITGAIYGDPADGIVDFTPTTEDADNVGVFFHEVEVTDSGGGIRTLIRGQFIMLQDIAK